MRIRSTKRTEVADQPTEPLTPDEIKELRRVLQFFANVIPYGKPR